MCVAVESPITVTIGTVSEAGVGAALVVGGGGPVSVPVIGAGMTVGVVVDGGMTGMTVEVVVGCVASARFGLVWSPLVRGVVVVVTGCAQSGS